MKANLLALAAAAGTLAIAAPPAAQAAGPCGTTTAIPQYTHVIWIFEENHSYGSIVGSRKAPYINSIAKECGLATKYHNISHPSLPNYVGATSGLSLSALKPFTPDCNPVAACTTSAPSIFGQTSSWKAYEESMPSNCFMSDSGEYAVRHNPPPYFTSLTNCATNDVPYTQLAGDLAAGTLPAFSFITPNLIDDMHDGTIAEGDAWLKANLPTILSSAEYASDSTVVLITWDEGEGGLSNNCATNQFDVGCHVPAIVISPSTKAGAKSSTLFNHYSLLGTTEQLLGLPKLGLAATANTMLTAFHL